MFCRTGDCFLSAGGAADPRCLEELAAGRSQSCDLTHCVFAPPWSNIRKVPLGLWRIVDCLPVTSGYTMGLKRVRLTPPQSFGLSTWIGWRMVLAASLTMACTLPGRTHALGLITMPLLADFTELSETQYASMNLWATLVGSLACLPAGWLIDRYGSQVVGTFSVIVLGFLVWWMSRVETLSALGMGIMLTRMVGQSMLSVVSLAIIGKAFPNRSTMAMGIYAILMTVLMAAGTGIVMTRISSEGWRLAWGELGIGLLVTAPILLWLLGCRQVPIANQENVITSTNSSDSGATLSEALRSPCFWLFATCVSFFGLTSSGISLFQQSILVERGLGEAIFQTVVIGGLLVGLLANLLGGWLAMRFSLPILLGCSMLLLGSSLLTIPFLKSEWHAYLYCLGYATSGGMITVLFFSVWGQAFGTSHLARIQGAAQMSTVVASSLGPLVISYSHEKFRRYDEISWILAIIALALGLLAFFVRMPSAANAGWKTL